MGEAHGYNSAKVGFTRSEKKIMPGTKGGVGVQSWEGKRHRFRPRKKLQPSASSGGSRRSIMEESQKKSKCRANFNSHANQYSN